VLGEVALCDAVRCEQGAALDLDLSLTRRWWVSAGGNVRRSLLISHLPTTSDRHVDLYLGSAARNVWVGRGAGERTRYDSLGLRPSRWLEYGAAMRWTSVSAAVQIGRGTEWVPGAERQLTRTRTVTSLDTATGQVHVDSISETVSERSNVSSARWTSAEMRLDWRSESWRTSAVVGRLSTQTGAVAVWSRGEAEHRIGRRMAVLASLGTYPLPASLATQRTRWTSSLSLTAATGLLGHEPVDLPRGTTSAAPFLVVPLGDARFRIILRLPGAGHVELASDLTAWRPVAMQRADGDRWSVDLSASPGSHGINIRIDDGPWITPAGLVADTDDFGGSVGVFVIQ
jgi:hypothetical protein